MAFSIVGASGSPCSWSYISMIRSLTKNMQSAISSLALLAEGVMAGSMILSIITSLSRTSEPALKALPTWVALVSANFSYMA